MSSLRLLTLLVALLSVALLSVNAQTNLLVNGDFESSIANVSSTNGWTTPQGTSDAVEGNSRSLSRYGNFTTAGPNGFSYSGLYSLLFEAGTLNQSVTQAVAVTGGHQYIFSFFLMFADVDADAYFQASYQHNTEAFPTVLLTPATFASGSAGTTAPFWWSQFKYTINAPSSASTVNITFLGCDREYGFLLDYATLYDAGNSGSTPTVSAPGAPPALTPNPAGNLLVNGDFESGSIAPWREPNGDNPFSLSVGGEGAYDFNGYAPRSGISCPQGNYCFTFGAPYATLPIQQTVSVSTSQNYTLSFLWYTVGGYNASNPSDAGSQLALSVGWNSGTLNTVFAQINNTAAASGNATIQLGTPPSGTQSLTMRFDGYSWPTYNVIDYVVLTSTASSSPNNKNNGVGAGRKESGVMAAVLGAAALGAAMLL